MSESIQKAVEALRLAEPESVEDLEVIITEVRDLQRRYERSQQRAFSVGDRVQFEGKGGEVITGVITRKLQKNVKVLADNNGVEWRVSPGLLTHA